jgi:NADPH:quinone reductase-like Zn-dependent oxidoreductase
MQEVEVPQPAQNQVLIRVIAAPVNPSDYGSWIRCRPEQCPYAMGNEGCGVVVKKGEGLMTTITTALTCRVGTRVGFIGLKQKQGSYSEYVVADASNCFPMPDDVPIEDCASFFVNPYTAVGILDTAKHVGSKAFVHTAAASQLGQMIVKLAPSEDMEVINVVRREEQAELLKGIGAKHVVVTGSGDAWKEELQTKIKELDAKVAFDAVAGRMTGDLVDLLPKQGTVYVYGVLAGRVENVDPVALIYHEKIVKGFYMTAWIQQGGMMHTVPRMLLAGRKVNAGLKEGGWSSTQFKDTTLENVQSDLVELLNSGITGRKLRIRLDQ